MKIKTKLLLNTILFAATSLIIVWFVIISTRLVNNRVGAVSEGTNLAKNVFELNITANEYLVGLDVAEDEWNTNYDEIKDQISEYEVSDNTEQAILDNLSTNLEKLDTSFESLVEETAESSEIDINDRERLLISQLLSNSKQVANDAYELSKLAENQRIKVRRTFDFALVVFVVVIGAISTAIGYVFSGSIVKSLRKLQVGANKIATGDLDYRVAVDGRDEMAHLARTFNEMADRLKEIYEGLDMKVRDRTKALADKVRESERERAKDVALLENIGEGIIGMSDRGDISLINKEAENLLGYSEEELLGEMYVHKIGLIDGDKEKVRIQERPVHKALLAAKPVNSRDYKLVRKDGKSFPADITATPIVLHGQVIGGVVVFKDITKEKEIDRMKTEFISLASHQLRTPLSAMKWFSEILLSGDAGKMPDEQKEMVENIYQSTERMVDLVNALLNISRIESGRIIIDPEPTDVKKLVQGVVDEVKQKIDMKNINFALSVHEDLPDISIDPKLIRNVYQNLITNAIKYTPEDGNIEIFISKKGSEVISQVSDSGYGIPEEEQSRVFERFFRGQNILKLETEGTGLGLYLAKAIVESSGGKMWFESKEGEGTTFWFSLPLKGTDPKKGEVSIS